MPFVTPKQLAKPHLRLRKTGKTAFHLALENRSYYELIEWVQSGKAPLDRLDRDGNHPITAYLDLLQEKAKMQREGIKEAPEWWHKYPTWGGQQGWEESEQKKLKALILIEKELSDQFITNIDWTKITKPTLDKIRKNLPRQLEGTDEGFFVDKLLKAGLKLSPLVYHGVPMTMASWCLCVFGQSQNVEFWLDRSGPDTDNPQDPGFFSVLVASWDLHKYTPEGAAIWGKKALELGASLKKPTLSIADRTSYSFDDIVFVDKEPAEKTILGQAAFKKDINLNSILMGDNQLEKIERIELFHALLKETIKAIDEKCAPYASSTDLSVFIQKKVDVIIEKIPDFITESKYQDRWKNIKQDILFGLILNIPLSRFPLLEDAISNIFERDKETKIPVYDFVLKSSLDKAINRLPLADTIKWIKRVNAYSYIGTALRKSYSIKESLLIDVLSKQVGNENIDRKFGVLRYLVETTDLQPEVVQTIEKSVFANKYENFISLKEQINILRDNDFVFSDTCWKCLVERLTLKAAPLEYSADNVKNIEQLALLLKEMNVIPGYETVSEILTQNALPDIPDNTTTLLSEPWDEEVIFEGKKTLLRIMLTCYPDVNQEDGAGNNILQYLLKTANQEWIKNKSSNTADLLKVALECGAVPNTLLKEGDVNLPLDHPYWEMMAEHTQNELENNTAAAKQELRKPVRL